MSAAPSFRELYGDELADAVEAIKNRPRGVEVLRPRRPVPPRTEPPSPPPEPDPELADAWWNQ